MVTSGSGFHRYEHILTEGGNFKTFLKEGYAVDLDSCFIYTKKNVKIAKLNMILIVLMECAYITDIPELCSTF